MQVSFELNGAPVKASIDPSMRLIDLLRKVLKLTGTKEGCGEGECGACTVIVDNCAVNSCLFPAPEVDGKKVITIEGLAQQGGKLSIIQEAFVKKGAIQCGFCTPGMILSSKALLDRNPEPSDDEIIEALLGNLCRCTGYVQIIEAVRFAASEIKKVQKEEINEEEKRV